MSERFSSLGDLYDLLSKFPPSLGKRRRKRKMDKIWEGGVIRLEISLIPKVLHIILFVGSKLWGLLLNLICWFQTFQPIIKYGLGNFVYHHCGCIKISRQLSYPLRSLDRNQICIKNDCTSNLK